ncbi:ABC transporter permease [Parabacteroides sp. Marseille-P3160]|uniref:ABC transporter permease n=1 Tax=Parabacteroides sp. Marseille-P3160 TaxID=1917887 RepID=UPI0009B9568E|nr:ABC transporter permease [Parabacteroides sp. Marseille-P3160]
MSKIGLVIKREYLRRVSKKSFILLTFLTPILMVALIFVPLWLATLKGDEVKQVVISDTTGKYAQLFENTEQYHFIHSDKSLEEYRNSKNKELFAILNITDDLLKNPKAAAIYSEKQIPSELSDLVNKVLGKQLEVEKMATFNIPNLAEIIRESRVDFNIQTIKWSKDGSETISSVQIAYAIGFIFTMLIFMFIMMYGAMVMNGVMEEKTNRIVEVMVSSIKPFDLMMGKVIGIGLVGLTQLFLWGILTAVLFFAGQFLLGGGLQAALQESQNMQANMGTSATVEIDSAKQLFSALESFNFKEILLFFIIFFIGGYLLYASIFAAIGSAVDSEEDTQQFMAPISILLVFALYAGIYSMENPDGPLAFWCSLIPFTSPIVMMMRLPYDIPLWQILLSVTLLYATSIGFVRFSGKIYRVGILMYGKKPNFKEMLKWLKYK